MSKSTKMKRLAVVLSVVFLTQALGMTAVYAQSDQVSKNVIAARALFKAEGPEELGKLFVDGAVFQYSLGDRPPNGEQINVPVGEWLATLGDDFKFVNAYAAWDAEPIFTPVNAGYNDLIMLKAKTNIVWVPEVGTAQNEYWMMELTFDADAKITKLRAAPDPDEAEYLKRMASGEYDYDTTLPENELRLLNQHTIQLWWSCHDLLRNIQRRILVTDDATKSMNGSFMDMWVGDEDGNYVSGWLNPDQSTSFIKWGFFALDGVSDPDKLYECKDLPDVFLVDALGIGINVRSGKEEAHEPNFFLQFTMRDDAYIANFRELAHNLNSLDE